MTYAEKKARLEQVRLHDIGLDISEASFLVKELEKAWAALEFYEKSESYWPQGDFGERNPKVLKDFGKRAREALDK